MKIKAVRFSQGVRCGKGSIEELFIDSTVKAYYDLELDETTNMLTVTNAEAGKTIIVFPTNIAYYEPTRIARELPTKRASKTITQ